jgi:predicted RNA binding protein YcfA (HicA-like mRNA interferase family)
MESLALLFDHQTGSHIILRHSSGRRLTIPNHRVLVFTPRETNF